MIRNASAGTGSPPGWVPHGQGVVYEAYDASGSRYALKTLHRAADPFLRERFTREAEAARRVAPFCTARIVLAGVDGDVPYLVSEYVAGPTLAAAVRADGPPSPDAVLRLATGVATALSAIHQAGVVHRDLKPGNVLLGPDGPRIIDFGIARAPDMSLTATGAIMGTFGYMAPEVLAGQRATEASDVFAWAAVVLYAATGTEPFRGENIAEVAHRTTTVEPDLGALPPEIRPLMAAALAKDPRRRPTAAELLLGLVGAPVRAADPRAALMEAGARRAVAPVPRADAPADTAPKATGASGAGGTLVEATLGERAESAFAALAPAARLAAHGLLLRLCVPGAAPDGSQDSVRTAPPDELLADRPEGEQEEVTAAVQGLMAHAACSSRRRTATCGPPAPRCSPRGGDCTPGSTPTGRGSPSSSASSRRPGCGSSTVSDRRTSCAAPICAAASTGCPPPPSRCGPTRSNSASSPQAASQRPGPADGGANSWRASPAATALALLAGGLAWTQSRDAERRRTEASARAVARAAANLPATDPETAMLLGLASWRISEVPEARAALTAAAVQPERSVVDLGGLDDGEEKSSTLTRDGRRLVAFSSRGIRIFDMTKGRAGAEKPLVNLSPDAFVPGDAGRPAFSPDEQAHAARRQGRNVPPHRHGGRHSGGSAGQGAARVHPSAGRLQQRAHAAVQRSLDRSGRPRGQRPRRQARDERRPPEHADTRREALRRMRRGRTAGLRPAPAGGPRGPGTPPWRRRQTVPLRVQRGRAVHERRDRPDLPPVRPHPAQDDRQGAPRG